MTKVKEVVNSLELLAPISYAESYDNPGLITGDFEAEVSGVLVSLDCTEAVVDEAIARKCNLIVSHHPIVFKGLKKLTGASYVERTVIKAIRNNVSIYAAHTNLDSVPNGVNGHLAEKLGLEQSVILKPKDGMLAKLTFFVPTEYEETVRQAVFAAGAGQIGNYAQCSFAVQGSGTFTPLEGAHPFAGKVGVPERANEVRVEVVLPRYLDRSVLKALFAVHPYEEVAYYLHDLANANQNVGSGMVGELPEAMSGGDFLSHLKKSLGLQMLRFTAIDERHLVKRVAVCGGSGSFLLASAKRAGADAFVTADFKYHEFFDGEGEVLIADIGHYESERFTIELLGAHLSEKFSTFATLLTEVNTNPVQYYY